MAVKQIGYVAVMVKDVARATEFYTRTFGLTPIPEMSEPGAFTSFKMAGGSMLGIVDTKRGLEVPDFPDAYELSFEVDDVEGAYRSWKAAGVQMVGEPHDMPFGRTFHLRTPDGHTIRIFQAAPR